MVGGDGRRGGGGAVRRSGAALRGGEVRHWRSGAARRADVVPSWVPQALSFGFFSLLSVAKFFTNFFHPNSFLVLDAKYFSLFFPKIFLFLNFYT